MTKQCQNCKTQFEVTTEDQSFYQKINVPAPTFCPKCRLQRRLAFFNLINLYKRPCDLCRKDVISMYAPESPYRVYCPRCWWSDNWDAFEYGRDYDFSRPFFEQFNELWHEVPMLGLSLGLETLATSPHNNHAGHLKNCYLLFHADVDEDCAYGVVVTHNRSVLDCSLINSSELCYDSMHSYKNNRCVGTRSQVTESLDCVFLKDSMNCQNCFASANLRGRKYHIFNKPYTKEEYFKEIGKWDLGSYKTYKELQKRAEEHWKMFPPKPTMDEFAINSTGSHVFQSKNCKECFEVVGAEDCKFISITEPPMKDCYDISSWGHNLTLAYECCVVGEDASNVRFSQEAGLGLYDTEYSKLSLAGSNHFGCVSINKGDYCILNKRYSKEEFEKLRERIVAHMEEMPYTDKKGRVYKYGEFFPIEFSPFAYNETVANDFFPLSREQTEKEGYRWRELESRQYVITITHDKLPDHIRDTPDDILKEVISCKKCGKGFKIIQMELEFLRKMNLPLPRECPFCRIDEKFKQWVKNLRVFKRVCSKCGSEFETNYPKEEVEYILCKKCYQAEVI
ncbi:MAG: hypothetical protein KJI72_01025 [Patescibacteria group bacterium]|nr:hypothetical protein [Patescibacteria group bacterium]